MVEIKEITDKKVWDSFLSGITNESYPFFQSWDWIQVQRETGFSVARLGLYDGSEVKGIAAVTDVNARRGHYLHLRHGPVLKDFEKDFDDLLIYIKSLAKKRNISFIRISPLIKKETISLQFFEDRGFRYAPIHNMDAEICSILALNKSEDELLKKMRKSHR